MRNDVIGDKRALTLNDRTIYLANNAIRVFRRKADEAAISTNRPQLGPSAENIFAADRYLGSLLADNFF